MNSQNTSEINDSIFNRYLSMLREKEQRMLHMGDEISRLTIAENENKRKDEIIQELRTKIAQMDIATAVSDNRKISTNYFHANTKLIRIMHVAC